MSFIKTTVVYLLLHLICIKADAQHTGKIYGQLADTVTHQQLKDAFITVTRASDNVVQKTIFSNTTGGFSCDNLPYGDYSLHISFSGLAPVNKAFTLDGGHAVINLDTIYLFITVRSLDTLVVQEPPIILKKDTVEYNASRFPTQPYAALADLVKRLPGIILNNDGTITINGQKVDQIMVDGEPFFTGDPQVALEHLPADIIKKIQVFATDDKTGPPPVPGTQRPRTLNVVLKADKRKGEFGRGSAAAGTGGAYNVGGDVSRMNGKQQTALIADLGNVERERHGVDAVQSSTGIQRVLNGGLNYRDSRKEHVSYTGNYVANDNRNESLSRGHTLNIYPGDSSTTSDQSSNGVTHTFSQRANGRIEFRRDKNSGFSVMPTINLQQGDNTSTQQNTQRNASTGEQTYQSTGTTSGTNKSTQVGTGLQFVKRYGDNGKLLMISSQVRNNESSRHSLNETQIDYATYSKDIHQQSENKNSQINSSSNMLFTIPLGKKYTINTQAAYSFNKDHNGVKTYKFNDETGHFDQLDTTQSNTFNSNYHMGNAQANVRAEFGKYSVTAGTGVEGDWLHADNITTNTQLSRRFINMLPQVLFVAIPRDGRTLSLGYNGKPNMVSVSQLQPVTTTADSLYIQEGNPDLKQPYTHVVSFGYSSIRIGTQRMVTVNLSANVTAHSIAQATTLLDNGAQVTKPINLEGAQNVSLNMMYSIPIQQEKGALNVSGNVLYAKNPVVSNGVRNDSRSVMVMTNVMYNYNNRKGLDVTMTVGPGYSMMKAESGPETKYFTVGVTGKGSYIYRNWEAGLGWYYSYNSSLPSDYQARLPLLAPVVKYRLLKSRALQVSVSVVDLLNQQSGASRSVSATMVADSWVRTRGRYGMVGVMYNFRRFH